MNEAMESNVIPERQVKKRFSLLGNFPKHLLRVDCTREFEMGYTPFEVRSGSWVALLGECLRVFREGRKHDAVLFYQDRMFLFLFCLLAWVFPWGRPRIISVDLICHRPQSVSKHIKSFVQKQLLRKVDLFLLHAKDLSSYSRYVGIDARRSVYIHYMVKSLSRVLTVPTSDERYILSCGRSTRDYATLIAAVKGLPYRVKILCPENELCLKHETDLATLGADLPTNVEIDHDDGSYESWLAAMARSRMVVLPITHASMYAHGAGTYLVAMALKKCVIISENEGSHGILDDGQAILVPVGDPDTLRRAIVRAWEDDAYREKIAEAGYKYAVTMGDEESLQRRILEACHRYLAGASPG